MLVLRFVLLSTVNSVVVAERMRPLRRHQPDRISNVYNLARTKNDSAFNANSKLNRFSQICSIKRPLTNPVRLSLAVTTNSLDVLVDNAVLCYSIMVFNILILCVALCVVI